MATTKKKPLEGKQVDSLEDIAKRKEETGTELVNPFIIEPIRNTPGMFKVRREKGTVPGALSGMFTSQKMAQIEIERYLAY